MLLPHIHSKAPGYEAIQRSSSCCRERRVDPQKGWSPINLELKNLFENNEYSYPNISS